MDFKVEWNHYIEGHKEIIKDHSFSNGIEAWKKHLNNLTAEKDCVELSLVFVVRGDIHVNF